MQTHEALALVALLEAAFDPFPESKKARYVVNLQRFAFEDGMAAVQQLEETYKGPFARPRIADVRELALSFEARRLASAERRELTSGEPDYDELDKGVTRIREWNAEHRCLPAAEEGGA
jgi:hypothetical protein